MRLVAFNKSYITLKYFQNNLENAQRNSKHRSFQDWFYKNVFWQDNMCTQFSAERRVEYLENRLS